MPKDTFIYSFNPNLYLEGLTPFGYEVMKKVINNQIGIGDIHNPTLNSKTYNNSTLTKNNDVKSSELNKQDTSISIDIQSNHNAIDYQEFRGFGEICTEEDYLSMMNYDSEDIFTSSGVMRNVLPINNTTESKSDSVYLSNSETLNLLHVNYLNSTNKESMSSENVSQREVLPSDFKACEVIEIKESKKTIPKEHMKKSTQKKNINNNNLAKFYAPPRTSIKFSDEISLLNPKVSQCIPTLLKVSEDKTNNMMIVETNNNAPPSLESLNYMDNVPFTTKCALECTLEVNGFEKDIKEIDPIYEITMVHDPKPCFYESENNVTEQNEYCEFSAIVDQCKSKKKTSNKRINQVKISEIPQSKKIKKSLNKTPLTEINSNKIKVSTKERKVNETVNSWLNQINDFVDIESMLKQTPSQAKDNTSSDAIEVLFSKNYDIGNSKGDIDKPKDVISNQTILTSGADGRMSFKKVFPSVVSLPLPSESNVVAKKKSKLITPLKKEPKKVKITYDIENLDDKNVTSLITLISENIPIEINFTIIYREGFSQLDKVPTTTEKNCNPKALMFHIKWKDIKKYFYMAIFSSSESTAKKYANQLLELNTTSYYYFKRTYASISKFAINLNTDNNFELNCFVNRMLISNMMNLNVSRYCFESQEMIIFLSDVFKFKRSDICLKWTFIDPKIGCFLLDPDNPPSSFTDILTQLSVNKVEIESSCLKQNTANCLTLLSESCQALCSTMKQFNVWTLFINLEIKLIPILSAMELRGICIDTKVLSAMSSTLNDKLIKMENEAFVAAGKHFQLNSPIQLRGVLFDDLKLDVKYQIKVKETSIMGAKSTSEPVLRLLAPLHPLPGIILNYRHVSKARATFVESILQHSKCGIIRSTWDQTCAATGRITSCNPNLQAIPKQPFILNIFQDPKEDDSSALILRNAFISRPGYSFVAADFQHIEFRVFAHMTRDQTLIDIFNLGIDIFRALAKKWLNKASIEDVCQDDRDKTKRIVYALMYGAGIQKLMEILHLDMKQTFEVVSKFGACFPALRGFGQNIIKKCRNQGGILHSLSGRMRRFPHINHSEPSARAYAERQAVNFVIQGSAADLCKSAMICTEQQLTNLSEDIDHHLILQIHDELVWEVPDTNVDQLKGVVSEVMEKSGDFCGGLLVPLPISISQGKSWGEMK